MFGFITNECPRAPDGLQKSINTAATHPESWLVITRRPSISNTLFIYTQLRESLSETPGSITKRPRRTSNFKAKMPKAADNKTDAPKPAEKEKTPITVKDQDKMYVTNMWWESLPTDQAPKGKDLKATLWIQAKDKDAEKLLNGATAFAYLCQGDKTVGTPVQVPSRGGAFDNGRNAYGFEWNAPLEIKDTGTYTYKVIVMTTDMASITTCFDAVNVTVV
ncbi:hypothetical protein GE09DRAFT_1189181 [Coniochaeta sp. 2T2.1]|nr:hypothetical protein GE09DRAFT_1189181 [Coniochaeta sp. 2T2.1]